MAKAKAAPKKPKHFLTADEMQQFALDAKTVGMTLPLLAEGHNLSESTARNHVYRLGMKIHRGLILNEGLHEQAQASLRGGLNMPQAMNPSDLIAFGEALQKVEGLGKALGLTITVSRQ